MMKVDIYIYILIHVHTHARSNMVLDMTTRTIINSLYMSMLKIWKMVVNLSWIHIEISTQCYTSIQV